MSKKFALLPIKKLVIADYCPRLLAHEDAIKELAENIKRAGVVSPLHVRKRDDGLYEIFSGSMRFRALQLLREEYAPCIIHDIDETEAKKLALAEAVIHEDHTAEELASYIRRLLKEKVFRSKKEIAIFLGKSEQWVNELDKTWGTLEELRSARELQTQPELMEYVDFPTARELARKPEPEKKKFIQQISSEDFREWAKAASPDAVRKVVKTMVSEGKKFEDAVKELEPKEFEEEEDEEEEYEGKTLAATVKWEGKSGYNYELFTSEGKLCLFKYEKETLVEQITIPKEDVQELIEKLQELL